MSELKQPAFPPSSDPKDVLKVLIAEIEKPVIAIQGIAELLDLEDFEAGADAKEYFQRIQKMSVYIRYLLDEGHAYLEEQNDAL